MRSLIRIFLFLFIGVLLHSCYGSNHLTTDFGLLPVYDQDSSMIAFSFYPKVFRPAKGIARFPDGGISKTVYSELIIYLYNRETHTLIKVYSFSGLPYLSRSRWSCEMQFANSYLYFNLKPAGGWESLGQTNTTDGSSLEKKYSGWFAYSIQSGEISRNQSTDTLSFHGNFAGFSEMTEMLKDFTWSDYGLFLSDILPDSKNDLLKDLERLEGNRLYRETIIQQFVTDLDPQQINKIIRRIERNSSKFSESEIRQKRFAKEETIKMLNEILNK